MFGSERSLWLLIAVAGLAVAYVLSAVRRRGYAVRFTELALLSSVAPRRPQWWKRHVPAGLLLLSLLGLVLALARPAHAVRVAQPGGVIMLAIDVSESMVATDVTPNRLVGAQNGARAFLDAVPAQTRVGLVAFAGTASLVVPPTTDRGQPRSAVEQLQPAAGTAIGDAIDVGRTALQAAAGQGSGTLAGAAAIVLLSDGTTNHGVPNEQAASAARQAGIPVNTIAYGTPDGVVTIGGQQIPVPVDEQALKDIAAATGGSYHRALTANAARDIYQSLGRSLGYRIQRRDLTGWFTGTAFILGLAAASLSVAFTSRMP